MLRLTIIVETIAEHNVMMLVVTTIIPLVFIIDNVMVIDDCGGADADAVVVVDNVYIVAGMNGTAIPLLFQF